MVLAILEIQAFLSFLKLFYEALQDPITAVSIKNTIMANMAVPIRASHSTKCCSSLIHRLRLLLVDKPNLHTTDN